MTKKICLSFDHPSLAVTPNEKEAHDLIRKIVCRQLNDAGHEPFEAFLTGSPPEFKAEPSNSMHALIIVHFSLRPQKVYFNMDYARLPAGPNSAVPIPVYILEFPGVDYNHFTVSTNNVIVTRLAVTGERLDLQELLPELFTQQALEVA